MQLKIQFNSLKETVIIIASKATAINNIQAVKVELDLKDMIAEAQIILKGCKKYKL